ncbi:triosephosphate isomerase, putative [Theileria equi strain WA]|uniref:Triosephosphate isomerase n=1 Tax=Theileria equi strain WA TaxID=1537102 RepID=L0B1T3_THEEQ|nr:triosephosphate isomerase, putative [Theileria equi strain WA]AFZ81433.1 triosephosphate isomerase, putative [Theileria equi strain WA]|eukprot:XP_004831099.1 triosephosphate isomerase, putative [Theileria equi strain WA]
MKSIWIGGNWKCNGTKESIKKLTETLNGLEFDTSKIEVVVFPPNIYTSHASSLLDSKYAIGVQNVSQAKDGAFTGELSVNMLQDCGVVSALVGHSERRTLFGDSDKVVADKVKVLQDTPIQAVVCIGESLAEREADKVFEVITRQVDGFIGNVKDWSKIVIAYEPVWAIGTGKVATTEQVVEAHKVS